MTAADPNPARADDGLARVKPWLTVLALVALAAGLLARGCAPALAGSAVGLDRAIVVVDRAAAIGAQLFGMGATAALIVLAVSIVRLRLSPLLRTMAAIVASLGAFGVLAATAAPLPFAPALALGAIASLLGMLVAVDAARSTQLRGVGLALGALSTSALVRAVAIVLSAVALGASPRAILTPEGMPWLQAARGCATLGFGLEFTALGLALDWFTTGKQRSVRLGLGVAVVLLAALAVPFAVAGAAPDAGLASVLVNRSVGRLLSVPAPFAPEAVRVFTEVLGWLLAFACLLRAFSRQLAPAALCLMLVSRGATETALGAAGLTVAALIVALERGFDLARFVRPPERAAGSVRQAPDA